LGATDLVRGLIAILGDQYHSDGDFLGAGGEAFGKRGLQ
jgi:hypothetical protein